MPRPDLLALTPDDLAAMTNRGTVKRAQRELESGEATFTLIESDDGEVKVDWSDDAKCTFPAGKTASDARCNCVATTLCRHIVRSVLAYQKHSIAATSPAETSDSPVTETAAVPRPPAKPWDPGDIDDEQLAAHFKKNVLAAAQNRFSQGVLVDLVRSSKPTARFHQLACTLRFIVPGDPRYTHCDCAEPAPCGHVPLAVWAFRRLPKEQLAGFISTQNRDLPVPAELLDAGESLLSELADNGIAGLPATWKDRVLRLESRYVEADLIWPWAILAEIVHEYERYIAHDARFAPDHVAQLVGEWLIRADAIRSGTRATPQLLIRGSSSDRATDIGSARYIGIGCGVQSERGGVTLTAYLQDNDSGSIVAISRDFDDPPKDSTEPPRDFHRLAETSVLRGISLAALGSGQLLLQGGKRAADHRLIVGRAKASVNAQQYVWEQLRAPVLVDDFAELRARISALPPASLRPRYVAEDLHVLPVASVVTAFFDEATQTIEMSIRDTRGEVAHIRHPYLGRAREGAENLLATLSDPEQHLKFVAGQVRQSSAGLLIHPVALVFEKDGRRTAVQPWIDRLAPSLAGARNAPSLGDQRGVAASPAGDHFISDLLAHLGDTLLLGLRRADASAAGSWHEFARKGQSHGYHHLREPAVALSEELTRKLSTARWTSDIATPQLLRACLYAKLAQDLA